MGDLEAEGSEMQNDERENGEGAFDGELPCFAYGSNLDPEDLGAWVDRHRGDGGCPYPFRAGLGPALLPDHAPAFTCESGVRGGGVLDAVPRRGFAVPGFLFAVAEGGWASLDRKEGHPLVYRREPVTVLDAGGVERPAVVYRVRPEMRSPLGFVAPAPAYLDVVCRGLARHGLGDAHAREAAAASPRAGRLNALFVYGTLRRGDCRNTLLEQAGCRLVWEEAWTPGALLDLGAFPGLLPGEGGRVRGEVYAMPDPGALLGRLDLVEGFSGFGRSVNHFRRTALYVSGPGGERLLAWAYAYACPPPVAVQIPSGDWLRRGGGAPG